MYFHKKLKFYDNRRINSEFLFPIIMILRNFYEFFYFISHLKTRNFDGESSSDILIMSTKLGNEI